jgi:hypothetical protein
MISKFFLKKRSDSLDSENFSQEKNKPSKNNYFKQLFSTTKSEKFGLVLLVICYAVIFSPMAQSDSDPYQLQRIFEKNPIVISFFEGLFDFSNTHPDNEEQKKSRVLFEKEFFLKSPNGKKYLNPNFDYLVTGKKF